MINDKGEFGKVSKIRKKKIKKTNILLGFICILLAVLLGFILVTSYKSEQKESRHLSEIADDQQSGIEDYEAVKERAKELEEISSEEAEDTEDIKSKNTQKTQKKRIQLTQKMQIRQKIQKIRRQLLQALCAGEMI